MCTNKSPKHKNNENLIHIELGSNNNKRPAKIYIYIYNIKIPSLTLNLLYVKMLKFSAKKNQRTTFYEGN
jgi:hypothetical protein